MTFWFASLPSPTGAESWAPTDTRSDPFPLVTSSVNSSTVGYEKRYNEALGIPDQAQFVRFMNENLPQRPPNMGKIVEANRGPLVTERVVPSFLEADEIARLVADGATL